MTSIQVPPELAQFVNSKLGEWQPSVLVDQKWVDEFTAATRDDNPIHKAGWGSRLFPKPIVPALMPLAIADRLFKGGIRGIFPSYLVVFRDIHEFRPKRKIDIGQEIQLRYCIGDVTSDPGGVYALVAFQIRTALPAKTVCYGTLSFYLLKEE